MKVWIPQGEMAHLLGVSIPTLYWWRKDETLRLGREYRLKTPTSNVLLYNKDKTEKRINALCTTPIEA